MPIVRITPATARGPVMTALLVAMLSLNPENVSAEDLWTTSDLSKHWLLDADSDTERFRRLEEYLGGFSQVMREVGFRYRYAYFSIEDNNQELARYHWGKIGDAIIKGYRKRPARRDNAREFLDGAWQALNTSLKGNDADRIHADFKRAREACMECHRAEKVDFINNQALFRDTAEIPRPK